MRTQIRHMDTIILILAAFLVGVTPAWAATNQATDPGGGSITLTASGTVTVNSSALQLVKQVWSTGGACLASSPADATCNGSATTVTVAAGTPLKFVIFVKNSTAFALTDVRFQDVLDTSGTGFTYVGSSMKYDVTLADTATSAQIYTALQASVLTQTDAVGAPDDYASIVGGNLTVGAVVGQVNVVLPVAANKTFAFQFQTTKN